MSKTTRTFRHVVMHEDGHVLWRETYIFRRLFAIGQTFVYDYKTYGVRSCVLDGNTVQTVVSVSHP